MSVRRSQDEDRGARNQPHPISGFKLRSVVLGAPACPGLAAWRPCIGGAETEADPREAFLWARPVD